MKIKNEGFFALEDKRVNFTSCQQHMRHFCKKKKEKKKKIQVEHH